MKPKNGPKTISDIILKDIGLNIEELTSAVDAGRQLRKISPSLRFDMTQKEAFMRLLRSYQIEVQSRNCVFVLDQCTVDELMNVSGHMVQETPKRGCFYVDCTVTASPLWQKQF